MRKSPKSSSEVIERAVCMVFDAKEQFPSQWAAIESVAGKVGCMVEKLRKWVRQGERDAGVREGVSRPSGDRPPLDVMKAFVDKHRAHFEVEAHRAHSLARINDLAARSVDLLFRRSTRSRVRCTGTCSI